MLIDYDFTSRERELGRVVFALSLDKKRMSERIVIGKSDELRRRLNGGDGGVYYDESRPLGTLLLTFENDNKGEWNRNGTALRESYDKALLFESARWKMVEPVSKFLHNKYISGEPSAMFAAIRTWEDYLNCFNMGHGGDVLHGRLQSLYNPFIIYGSHKPWRYGFGEALGYFQSNADASLELWYPVGRRAFEVVVCGTSLLPLVYHYLFKVNEWGYVFRKCKVCGSLFLARSNHYEICSDSCRAEQKRNAKREFDERAKGDRLEQLDEAAYYYWYNRLRKMRKAKNAAPEREAAFKVSFDAFRKEAVGRKSAVKRGESTLNEFAGWLVEMQVVADKLMG